MKTIRTSLLCVALLLGSVFLAGCWDRKEMDELAFVMGSGLDLKEGGQVEGTIQIALPTGIPSAVQAGRKNEKSFMVVSATGKDGMEALGKLQQQLSRKINLGHRRIMVVDEKLARAGLNQLLDTILRSPESRYNSYIVTTSGTTAKAIMSTPYFLEQIPAIGINNILAGDYSLAVKADEFLDQIASYGKQPVTPAIRITKTESGYPTFALDQIAAYKENKLVGFLSGETRNAFYLLRRNTAGLTWMLQWMPPNPQYLGNINMQFLNSKTTIRTSISAKTPKASIDVKASGRIVSNNTDLDVSKPENISQLEQAFARQLRQSIAKTVALSQQQFQSDIFGIGRQVHIEHPQAWKKLKEDWASIYPTIPIEIYTHVIIERMGRTLTPGHSKK